MFCYFYVGLLVRILVDCVPYGTCDIFVLLQVGQKPVQLLIVRVRGTSTSVMQLANKRHTFIRGSWYVPCHTAVLSYIRVPVHTTHDSEQTAATLHCSSDTNVEQWAKKSGLFLNDCCCDTRSIRSDVLTVLLYVVALGSDCESMF